MIVVKHCDLTFDVIARTITNVLRCTVWKSSELIFSCCGLLWLYDVVWFDLSHDAGECESQI